jgi:glutaminase
VALPPRTREQIEQRLGELYRRHVPLPADAVEAYYDPGREYLAPEESGDAAETFGIALADLEGDVYATGDHDRPFALQSVSKVFAYCLALQERGRERVLEHVGVEPSGDPFNAIELDHRSNRPHNPMVNAGALATTDLLLGDDAADKLERILVLMRRCAGNDALGVDPSTLEGELRTADRNRAIAYLMRSQGMLAGDVEETLRLYLEHCSITVTCDDLAVMGATLAAGGTNPLTGDRVLDPEVVRDVLSVMHTCGMYDFAGAWAFDIGVPAKSGVSGGILAVIPEKMGVAVLSPGLDAHGNSVRGVRVCQDLSRRLGLHVFAAPSEDAMLRTAAQG